MGSTTISYAVVALAIALICLLLGFFWGRSRVKSQVEDAVEKERISLDAREFAMREQLEEAIAEIARLRPLAEGFGRVQEGPKREQMKHERMKAEFSSRVKDAASEASGEQELARGPQKPRPTPECADQAIKRLMQSLETFNHRDESPPTGEQQHEEPKLPQQAEMAPRAPQPVLKEPILPQMQEKKPGVPPSPETRPQVIDEWQEFARSLAALTGRKQ
jgi:FtsZ-interacting cell division protein ZipA